MKFATLERSVFVAKLVLGVAVFGCGLPGSCGAEDGLPDAALARQQRESLFHRYLGISALIRGGSVEPHWLADGSRFWYAGTSSDGAVIYLVDPAAPKRPLFDVARVRKALAARLGHEPKKRGLPFSDFTFLDGETRARFSVEKRQWILSLADYTIVEEEPVKRSESTAAPRMVRKGFLSGEPPVMEVPSPDGRWLATEKGHNLFVRAASGERIDQLTNDGFEDYAWSVSSAQWSPDSSRLTAARIDQRGIPSVPVVHWLKPVPDVDWYHIARPGGKLPHAEWFIFDRQSRARVAIDQGPDSDASLTAVRWRPDGSELLMVRVDREYKTLDLLAADGRTATMRAILTEKQKTFVQPPLLGPYNVPILADGKRFLWTSERDGWNHIYLYDLDGNLLSQLTSGEYPVVKILTVDERGSWVYFTAHGDRERPYDTHLYRVNLSGAGFAQLTHAPGQHDYPIYLSALQGAPAGIQFSPSKDYFLDTHSSPDRPPVVELCRADGKTLETVERADVSGLGRLGWKPPEPFRVKAADGKTDLFGLLYKPRDFDAKRKYPVIDHIYNGPQTSWVPHVFNGAQGIVPQALAQVGFIVYVVDGRGTPERGKAFQDVVYGNFGRNEIPDHVAALRQLAAERPHMDLRRVGVFGGSFGGYMTVRALLLAPDVYHVGVATAPIMDLYDVTAEAAEMYMGLPRKNRSAYEFASNIRLAEKLQGKLLILHGTSDVNAPFANTMRMVAALIQAGKRCDLDIMPEQTHWPAGASRVHWLESMRLYFEENLEP